MREQLIQFNLLNLNNWVFLKFNIFIKNNFLIILAAFFPRTKVTSESTNTFLSLKSKSVPKYHIYHSNNL